MIVPIVAGKPIHLWLGMLLFVLLVVQLLTGKRVIKLPFKYHRYNAMLLITIAIIHAYFAIGLYFFDFTIGK